MAEGVERVHQGGGALAVAALAATLSACAPPPAQRAPAPTLGDGPPDGIVDAAGVPDAVPRYEPPSRYGNPDSYVVYGRRYRVLRTARNYVKRGVASWYGRKFHGRRTSSGEPYDMYAMTAAHRTLPLPTFVSVTNLENRRRIVVRVNDRGPFHDDRLIDLSYVAASKLGIVAQGTGRVEVRAIEPADVVAPEAELDPAPGVGSDPGSPPSIDRGRIYLQAGAFAERVNAERLSARLRSVAEAPVRVAAAASVHRTVYRVRLGPLDDLSEADRLTRFLLSMGLEAPRLVVE